VLSNRIWIMPQQNRAGGSESAEVLYRSGAQQGRVAARLPLDSTEDDLATATAAFVETQLAEYRAVRRAKQKNPTRTLKKYFDRGDIQLIDDAIDIESDSEIARRLL